MQGKGGGRARRAPRTLDLEVPVVCTQYVLDIVVCCGDGDGDGGRVGLGGVG